MSGNFPNDVESMYDAAAENLGLPEGLAEKIKSAT